MLVFAGIAAALGAMALTVRWLVRRHDELGRARPAPVVAISLLLVVASVAAVFTWRHDRLEGNLSEVATALVGQPSVVSCQTVGASLVDAGGELGYVKWGPDGVPERQTLIKRDVCNDLAAFSRNPSADAPRDQVIAVHILTHESMHMAGERAESIAECQAVQRNAETARLLGASADVARRIAQRYYADLYPGQSADYKSADCASGRALDTKSPDAPWL